MRKERETFLIVSFLSFKPNQAYRAEEHVRNRDFYKKTLCKFSKKKKKKKIKKKLKIQKFKDKNLSQPINSIIFLEKWVLSH